MVKRVCIRGRAGSPWGANVRWTSHKKSQRAEWGDACRRSSGWMRLTKPAARLSDGCYRRPWTHSIKQGRPVSPPGSVDAAALEEMKAEHLSHLMAVLDPATAKNELLVSGRLRQKHETMGSPSLRVRGTEAALEKALASLMDAKMKPQERKTASMAFLRFLMSDLAAASGLAAGPDPATSRMMAVSDSLDREMSVTLSEVRQQVDTLAQLANRLDAVSGEVTQATSQVAAAADSTRDSVNTVAGAAQELEASSQEITGQAEGASDQAGRTRRTLIAPKTR